MDMHPPPKESESKKIPQGDVDDGALWPLGNDTLVEGGNFLTFLVGG